MANGKLKGRQGGSKSKGPSSGKTSKRGAASSRGGSQAPGKSGKRAGAHKSRGGYNYAKGAEYNLEVFGRGTNASDNYKRRPEPKSSSRVSSSGARTVSRPKSKTGTDKPSSIYTARTVGGTAGAGRGTAGSVGAAAAMNIMDRIPFRNKAISKITKTNIGGSRTVSRPRKTK